MNQSNSFLKYAVFAFCMTIFGVIVGAGIGSYVGYTVALREQPSEAVVAEQIRMTGNPLPADSGKVPVDAELPADAAPETILPAQEATASGGSIVDAVSAVRPATVEVLTQYGSGSGVIISEEGYVVTNFHVIEGSRRFAVKYARGEQIEAQLVGAAPDFDLAVLKVEGAVPGVAAWGDSSAVPLGAQVIAIGSALGEYQNTVTTGILSGYNRTLDRLSGLLQTDAAINHGNSGGPLIDTQGQVIGINTMVVRGGRSQAEGLGFAIPSNVARGIVRQIIQRGYAERPYMGVDLITLNPQIAEQLGLEVSDGAYIRALAANSSAALAGIMPGDVITAINGRVLNDRDTLQMAILSAMPGETVTVTVNRGGDVLELTMQLGAA